MTSKTQTTDATMKAGKEAFETAAKASKETMDKAVKGATEAWTQGYDQITTLTREQIEKVYPAGVKNFDELTAQQKASIEALLTSGEAASKGAEKLGEEIVSYNQKAYEAALGNAKALMGAKTVQDVFEMQTGFVRESFDAFVAEQAKLSEMTVKFANEAVQPLNASWTKTVETFSKPFAQQG